MCRTTSTLNSTPIRWMCIFGSAFFLFWHSSAQPHWIERKKIVQLGWFRCVADTEYAYADKMDQANTGAHTRIYHTLREREAQRSDNAWNSNCWINGCWILAGCLESRRYQCSTKSQWKKCVPSFIVIKRHCSQFVCVNTSTNIIKHCFEWMIMTMMLMAMANMAQKCTFHFKTHNSAQVYSTPNYYVISPSISINRLYIILVLHVKEKQTESNFNSIFMQLKWFEKWNE